MVHDKEHHFTRWLLPEGHNPQNALNQALPGRTPAEAAAELDTLTPRELREVFAGIYGQPTTSNNIHWVRNKLRSALGVGGKKPPRTPTARKRSSSAAPAPPTPAKDFSALKKHWNASPASLPPSTLEAGPHGAAPRFARSPSTGSERDSSTLFVPLGPAADGAAALMAAAAELGSGGSGSGGPSTAIDLCRAASGSSGCSPSPPAPSAVPLESLLGGMPLHAALQASSAAVGSAGGASMPPPALPWGGVALPPQLPDLQSQLALLCLLAAMVAETSTQAH